MKLRNSPPAEVVAGYIAILVGDTLIVEVGIMVGHCYDKWQMQGKCSRITDHGETNMKFTEHTAAKYLVHQNVASCEIHTLKFSTTCTRRTKILQGSPRTRLANGAETHLACNIHAAWQMCGTRNTQNIGVVNARHLGSNLCAWDIHDEVNVPTTASVAPRLTSPVSGA